MKSKSIRALAFICVIILVGLNIAALILAFIPDPEINKYSMPCFFISILLPVVLFLHFKAIEFLKSRHDDDTSDTSDSQATNAKENQP